MNTEEDTFDALRRTAFDEIHMLLYYASTIDENARILKEGRWTWAEYWDERRRRWDKAAGRPYGG